MKINERIRFDIEWMVLSAIRDTVGIARRGRGQPGYTLSLQIGEQLAPSLFDPKTRILARYRESQLTQEYRQRAAAKTELTSIPTDPLDLVRREISELTALMEAPTDNKGQLWKRLQLLEQSKLELEPKKISEHQIIFNDVKSVDRSLPISGKGHKYMQYQIDKTRALRIQILHPDVPEHKTGIDTLYEIYDLKRNMVRLAAVQYKIWNQRTLRKDERMGKQLEKLKKAFCDYGICTHCNSQKMSKKSYRLPSCCAFLRPTDQLQSPDSELISSGLHIPLCILEESWEPTGRGGHSIASKRIRNKSLSHHVFEELFVQNIIGTNWIGIGMLEEVYKKHKVIEDNSRIVLHAQEYETD